MSYRDIVAAQLEIDEGRRDKMYKDSLGIWSIGVGINLEAGLRPEEIDFLRDNRIRLADLDARSLLENFDALSDARKAVVVNMSFNLGKTRLAGFVNTLKAIDDGRYADAADGMLASKWATQVGARAQRLAKIMRDG